MFPERRNCTRSANQLDSYHQHFPNWYAALVGVIRRARVGYNSEREKAHWSALLLLTVLRLVKAFQDVFRERVRKREQMLTHKIETVHERVDPFTL
jgi:hypothetical protein